MVRLSWIFIFVYMIDVVSFFWKESLEIMVVFSLRQKSDLILFQHVLILPKYILPVVFIAIYMLYEGSACAEIVPENFVKSHL